MPTKDVYLFDFSNAPLQVRGIRLELFDAATAVLLDAQNSTDLSPGPGGTASNEWGARLSFVSCNNPLDILIVDPTHRYPGNAVRSLNGQLAARIDIDLTAIPAGRGGQPSPPRVATPTALSDWVSAGTAWSTVEKAGAWNLIANYVGVVVPRREDLAELGNVAQNWSEALDQIGLPHTLLLEPPPSPPVGGTFGAPVGGKGGGETDWWSTYTQQQTQEQQRQAQQQQAQQRRMKRS